MPIISKIRSFLRGVQAEGFVPFLRGYLTVRDNTLQGRWVELRGNQVTLEGMVFSVATPAVPRINKSQLLQGRYEQLERDFVEKYLDPASPVIELGGGLGVISCVVNSRLHNPEWHVVVEANPLMISTLERNRQQNKCKFMILFSAIAYHDDIVTIHQSGFSTGINTTSTMSARVPTITLSQVAKLSGFSTFTLICDIEGAELDMIENDVECLQNQVTTIIMEIHPETMGKTAVEVGIQRLSSLGFSELAQHQDVYVFTKVQYKAF